MKDIASIVDRYVAVWNEGEATSSAATSERLLCRTR